VAEASGQIIGMVAVAEVSPNVGELRWLRVAPPWQEGLHIARKLVEMAANFAREEGLLKLMLHAPLHLQPRVADFLHSVGFEYSRSKSRSGRDMMEFYLNLYQRAGFPSHPRKGQP
jgi:N-acetylglutamate synthase-like GNAT family acetyltransferase